jgi:hypothetical protein
MSDSGFARELSGLAVWDLLFAALVVGLVGVICVRRWAGVTIPDRSGWQPQQVLSDQRFRLALGLVLATAWAGVAIAFIRHALQHEGMSPLVTRLGPLPLPPWLAFVLQDGHRLGLTYALWATGLWLDRSISKRWSQPRSGVWPGGQSAFAMFLALMALAFSALG